MTFTKLFSSITESTVWMEPDHIRLVWITMLAMADKRGRVFASIPGLANRARVPVDATESAINRFMEPDVYSRTADHDGRRIIPIDGGWMLLNYQKYREIRDSEERKEQVRDAVRRLREKQSSLITVSRGKPRKAQAEADAEAEANPSQTNTEQASPAGVPVAEKAKPKPDPADIYALYPRKVGKNAAIVAIQTALKIKSFDFLIERTKAYAAAVKLWPPGEEQYIPHPRTWFNHGRYDDDPATWRKVGHQSSLPFRPPPPERPSVI